MPILWLLATQTVDRRFKGSKSTEIGDDDSHSSGKVVQGNRCRKDLGVRRRRVGEGRTERLTSERWFVSYGTGLTVRMPEGCLWKNRLSTKEIS